MQTSELVDELHRSECQIPNLILLELKRREYDIQLELPHLQELLASPDQNRRTLGWIALTSVFPDHVDRIPNYHPSLSEAECKMHSQNLLNQDDG